MKTGMPLFTWHSGLFCQSSLFISVYFMCNMRAANAVGRRVSYFMVFKYAAFRLVKGNLLPCGLPPLAAQNMTFCRMIVNLLIVCKLLRCQKSRVACFLYVNRLTPVTVFHISGCGALMPVAGVLATVWRYVSYS